MYPVSNAYKQALLSDARIFDLRGTITLLSGEEITITSELVAEGGFSLSRTATFGDVYVPGGVCAADLSLSIVNIGGELDGRVWDDARINLEVGLKINSESDDSDNSAWEWVPMGQFFIDDPVRPKQSPSKPIAKIDLQASDAMTKFDVPLSRIAWNASFIPNVLQAVNALCLYCAVPNAVPQDIPNTDMLLHGIDWEEMSARDLLSNIAQLCGGWFFIDRSGALNFGRMPQGGAGFEVDPDYRYNFTLMNDPITITGAVFADELLQGTDDMAIDLTDNRVFINRIQEKISTAGIVNTMLAQCTTRYVPHEAELRDSPIFDPGDMIIYTGTDASGQSFTTPVFQVEYKFHGKTKLSAPGASADTRNYTAPELKQARRVTAIANEANEAAKTAMQQAQEYAFASFARVRGGYQHTGDYQGNLTHFVMDNANINLAKDIWASNINGIFHFANGINGPVESAWTEGMFFNSLITADMIKAGVLQSAASSGGEPVSWFNLNTGAFKLGDYLNFNGTSFEKIVAKQLKREVSDSFYAFVNQTNNVVLANGLTQANANAMRNRYNILGRAVTVRQTSGASSYEIVENQRGVYFGDGSNQLNNKLSVSENSISLTGQENMSVTLGNKHAGVGSVGSFGFGGINFNMPFGFFVDGDGSLFGNPGAYLCNGLLGISVNQLLALLNALLYRDETTITSLSNGFTYYSVLSDYPDISMDGLGNVFMRGILKPPNNSNLLDSVSSYATMFTIPAQYRPAKSQHFVCHGTSGTKWLLRLTTSGEAQFGRYFQAGDSSATLSFGGTSWLPFSVSWRSSTSPAEALMEEWS